MPNQHVSVEHGNLIIQTLQNLKQREGRNPSAIFRLVSDWCADKDREINISHQTLRNWCKAAEDEMFPRPKIAGGLLAYVLEKKHQIDPEDWQSMLVRSAERLFNSNEKALKNKLKRLEGTYEIIRKRWRPSGSNEYIKCIVWFDIKNDIVHFNEIEKLSKNTSADEDKVNESYEGYAFLFGTNVWVLAKENHGHNLKFINIHFCYPFLLDGDSPITRCRGNLIAVCGPGPCDSCRFVLRRTKNGERGCSYLSSTQIKLILDKEDYDYLSPNNEG